MRDVEVVVRLPLPLDVMGTITRLFGAAWPEAKLKMSGRNGEVVFVIPDASRPRRVGKKAAKPEPVDEHTADLLHWDERGPVLSLPEQVAHICRDALEDAFEGNPTAENYIEFELTDAQGSRYALVFARTVDQTPHALRAEAELRAQLAENEARAQGERAREAEARAEKAARRASAERREARRERKRNDALVRALGSATSTDDIEAALAALRALAQEHHDSARPDGARPDSAHARTIEGSTAA